MNDADLYNLAAYGAMIADEPRMRAYREAMSRHVGPDATVLDIGTGTGAHAFIACELGARRVYAVEQSDAIQLAREIAADNGLQDRIVFLQEASTTATLPERVDVVVSDLRGVLPLFRRHIPAIIDARERLLAPKGVLIPAEDRLFGALVEAPAQFDELVGPWDQSSGIDHGAARRLATQTWRKCRFEPEQLLTAPQAWSSLDYASVASPDAAGEIEATIERDATAHGIAVWFETTLVDGIGFSNRPGEPELIYGSAFFPFPEPVAVARGDLAVVEISADLVGEDYIWCWNTTVRDGEGEAPKQALRQSTFYGAALSPESLLRNAAAYAPTLSDDGRIDREALEMMDGAATLGEIADGLMDNHPGAFEDRRAALRRVAELSRRYSR